MSTDPGEQHFYTHACKLLVTHKTLCTMSQLLLTAEVSG